MGRSDVERATRSFLFCFLGGPRTPERVHEIFFWFIVHGVRETFVDRSCITIVAKGSRLTWAMGGKKIYQKSCATCRRFSDRSLRTICAVDLVMRASLHPLPIAAIVNAIYPQQSHLSGSPLACL